MYVRFVLPYTPHTVDDSISTLTTLSHTQRSKDLLSCDTAQVPGVRHKTRLTSPPSPPLPPFLRLLTGVVELSLNQPWNSSFTTHSLVTHTHYIPTAVYLVSGCDGEGSLDGSRQTGSVVQGSRRTGSDYSEGIPSRLPRGNGRYPGRCLERIRVDVLCIGQCSSVCAMLTVDCVS